METEQIRYTFVMKIKDLDGFRIVAEKIIENVKKEPGTYVYQWYLNEDSTQCVVYERYKDSDAWIQHVSNDTMQGLIPELMAAAEVMRFEVLGNVTPEAKKMMDTFGATYLTHSMGFER